MKRRSFLKTLPLGMLAATSLSPLELVLATTNEHSDGEKLDEHVKDNLQKIRDFDKDFADDIYLDADKFALLKSTADRLVRVQRLVGYANFSLLSLDDAIRYAKYYSKVGNFTRAELDFIESIFFEDAERYGFFGNKVITDLTARISNRETVKLPRTGHYLFKGEPLKMYNKIRKDVGPSVVLTSGIRGVVKQIHLFLAKAMKTSGNLSQASRSLAPPGHSYHGVGDFDVGKAGFGASNFTSAFSQTEEYKRLHDLGYVLIRYTETNPYGVRFEPWHIKVV
ncbi:MAG: M15 family metallopeptidase [Gammaproteobacteria bacterium]|nr:M15 family metallopeptidase [Gammaproteobacteria bacterium]